MSVCLGVGGPSRTLQSEAAAWECSLCGVHHAPRLEGSVLGFRLWCGCLQIGNALPTKGFTSSFCSESHDVGGPASSPFLCSVLQSHA